MEQKTVSGKIPAELHARFRSEMEARGWTMSFALEQVINEHFENEKGRNDTMENTRTLAFAVSEEFSSWSRSTLHGMRKYTIDG